MEMEMEQKCDYKQDMYDIWNTVWQPSTYTKRLS